VRRFSVLLVGLATVLFVAAAQARTHQTLTIKSTSLKVLYGHGATLTGRFTGRLNAGRAVMITARPYGSSAPHPLAAVNTTINGTWSYRVNPTIQTSYQAHVGNATSRLMTVGVAPKMSLAELGNGRIRVEALAGRSFMRATVRLQRRGAAGMWRTVDSKRLGVRSAAVFTTPLRTATIRATMSVNQAGAGYLGTMSHPLRYRPLALTMQPAGYAVMYGKAMTLRGRLINGGAGQRITIFAKRYGHPGLAKLFARTDAQGRFFAVVTPSVQTTYQASFAGSKTSHAFKLGVRPAMTLVERSDGSLGAHVRLGTSLRGRLVELQRRMSGDKWMTIARKPVKSGSNAIFSLRLPHSLVRAAMSVNQAGAGYLGTISPPFLYRAV
jgi:hypothetical protein